MAMRYPGGLIATSPVNAAYPSGVWTQSQTIPYASQNVWQRDQYWRNTTLLLHGDGTNGAQNNTFLDSSSNNFTITRNGNTTQGAFTPYQQNGYWSNYFDGSAAYLTTSSSAISYAGDFTVECWFSSTSTTTYACIYSDETGSTGGTILLNNGSNNGHITVYCGSISNFASTSTGLNDGKWHHVAFTRSGSTVRLFIDGALQNTTTASGTITTPSTFRIGNSYFASRFFGGYISNFRVTNTAVYTSAFTPSTTPLTAISGTSLLTCQSNRFVDNSSNAFAITVNGTPSVQAFQPFPGPTTWSASVLGGSGYFDGSGDYLSLTGTALGTGDFTIEFWLYPTTLGTALAPFSYGTTDNTSNAEIYIKTTGAITWYTFGEQILSGTGVIIANAWHHIAVTKSSGTTKMFVNGVQVGSNYSDSRNYTSTTIYIGQGYGVPSTTGYIANFRQTNTAVYTSAFTPPTSPVTAITGTQLLANFTNAGIFDNAQMNDLETVGNAQVSTSVVKYGTGSMAFDGSGDYLVGRTTDLLSFNTGDFTVEMWVYPNSVAGNIVLIDTRSSGTDSGWAFYINSSSKLALFTSNADRITAGSALSASTWTHVVLARSGSTLAIYMNGVQSATATYSTTMTCPGRISIASGFDNAAPLNGYIDDLRITKGVARYTANFTPPIARMPNQ